MSDRVPNPWHQKPWVALIAILFLFVGTTLVIRLLDKKRDGPTLGAAGAAKGRSPVAPAEVEDSTPEPQSLRNWRRLAAAPISGRADSAAVWTGKEMIVWGGLSGVLGTERPEMLIDGAGYDPVADTWRVIRESPLGRRHQFSWVWTGRQMIIWGGLNESGSPPNGAAYNPSLDTWEMLPSPPISGRYDFISVWTGREMIVWGGERSDPNIPISDQRNGAAYNPSSKRWRVLPSSPMRLRSPFDQVAVWSGREVFVWQCGRQCIEGEGAAYNPKTNSWRRLPAQPSYRAAPSVLHAVWDGQEMIVGDPLGDGPFGSAYDPALNLWRPIPAGPYARDLQQSLIWTGREMVLWGGGTSGRRSGIGAAYDPQSNTWRTIPQSPLLARGNHAAVWTGTEVLIWGGRRLFNEPSLSDGAAHRI